jgi:PTS system cellobiose-specific IIB component
MESILVVCGAGASSTFLAARLRKLATERGLDITARAGAVSDLPAGFEDAAVLLVGPHLQSEFEAIQALATEHSISAALLPATAFGPDGALAAFDAAVALIAAATSSRNVTDARTAHEGTLNA